MIHSIVNAKASEYLFWEQALGLAVKMVDKTSTSRIGVSGFDS